MSYDELMELIDAWITKNISEISSSKDDSRTRLAAKSGFFNAVLIAMTPQEREKLANDFNLKPKKDE